MSRRRARPAYDCWRDAEGTRLSVGTRVVVSEDGAPPARRGRRGEVVGLGRGLRLHVLFDGELRAVGIHPQLVRALSTEDIVDQLQELRPERGSL